MKLLNFFCLLTTLISLYVGKTDSLALPLPVSDETLTSTVKDVETSTITESPILLPEIPTSTESSSSAENITKITHISLTTESSSNTINPSEIDQKLIDKLSDQIGRVLKQSQHPELLQDSLSVPNTTTNLGGFLTGDFYNMTVHGLSNFSVEAMNTLLDQLEVYIMTKMKEIVIIGNCTLDTIIGIKSSGPFNITLYNVTAEGTVFLTVNPEGYLIVSRSVSYMTYDDLTISTTSGSILQTALNGAATAILAALKPHILEQIDETITKEVNSLLKDTPRMPFSANTSPVDIAILEGRRFVRQYYEPLEIKKIFDHNSEFLTISIGPVQVRGLSQFSRVGKVTLKMVNSTVQIGIRIITGQLTGQCNFFYDFGKMKDERSGVANFTIGHLQFEAKLNQSIDLRKRPILDDLQIETGKIAVHLDGNGQLDYLLELSLKFLPRMLRYVIIDALEESIKQKIQSEVLNKLNVDQLVQDKLPLLESILTSALQNNN